MKTFLTTSIAALALLAATSVMAEDITQDISKDTLKDKGMVLYASAQIEAYNLPASISHLSPDATIAVARIDGGRLILTPSGELQDWDYLNRRTSLNIIQLSETGPIAYIPEFSLSGATSENRIDEIRLRAANEGLDYVLIYGVGPDATWSSFGGKALVETGLSVKPNCAAWKSGKAKALLVNSFTGEVLGAAVADDIEFNIGQLADRTQTLFEGLMRPAVMAEADALPGKTKI